MYDDEMRTKEINNGRMAMISVSGILLAEAVSGKDAIEQLFGKEVMQAQGGMLAASAPVVAATAPAAQAAVSAVSAMSAVARPAASTRGSCLAGGSTSSTARKAAVHAAAFDPAKEPGAMDPLGYFDPLGFCPAGDKEAFFIQRTAELKHGRVAMMASIGLLGQHYLKLPGAEQIPSGIHALDDYRGQVLFFALFAWAGVLEVVVWEQDINKEPGNFGDPFGVGMYDDEMRTKEINNGRMAMISVSGILLAEAVSGKDAIEQLFGKEVMQAQGGLAVAASDPAAQAAVSAVSKVSLDL